MTRRNFTTALVIYADPDRGWEQLQKTTVFLPKTEFPIASPDNHAGCRSVLAPNCFDCHYRVTRQFTIAAAGVMLPAVGLQTTKFTFPLVT
jgi:hypothetical protein